MIMPVSLQSIFSNILRILPYLYLSAIVTGVAVVVLDVVSRGVWVGQRRFRILSIFYDLSGTGRFLLAVSWVRLLTVFIVVIRFKVLVTSDYGIFLIPGIIGVVKPGRFVNSLWALLALALQFIGLVGSNIICGYILEYGGGMLFKAIYLFMAVLLCLFSIIIFLIDLENISESRRADVIKSAKSIKTPAEQ